MNLLERYNEDVFEIYWDKYVIQNYGLQMLYDDKGILVSTNGLFCALGIRERQRDAASVLIRYGLKANIDVMERYIRYGVFDYYITLAAAKRIIAGCRHEKLADKVLHTFDTWERNLLKGIK